MSASPALWLSCTGQQRRTVLAGMEVAGAASDDVLCAFDEFSGVKAVVEKILFMLSWSKD